MCAVGWISPLAGADQTGPASAQGTALHSHPPAPPATPLRSSDPGAPVREVLRARVEGAGSPPRIKVGDERVFASADLPLFYANRGFEPAWVAGGLPLPRAEALLDAVEGADGQGLRPRNYHLDLARELIRRLRTDAAARRPDVLADLDLLLTDAFLVYGSHLAAGCVNPETYHLEWDAVRREADLTEVLGEALETDRVAEALLGLLPAPSDYDRLRAVLAQYRALAEAGGWSSIPDGQALRRGDTGERVPLLRRRLAATGDLADADLDAASVFGEELEAGVRRFQARHGLEIDGIVGRKTLAALNVPAAERAHQVELNLERWRWLPRDLGRRYVLVNIPAFELRVVEEGRTVLQMAVVVGLAYHHTPVFSEQIRYVVVNPFWELPRSIAVREILPQIRQDPGYLAAQRIRVLRGWGSEAVEIDPETVDWFALGPRNFPYRLRQDSGPGNALGRIKFMFPNKHNVYLHDTPARQLFSRAERDFSHGCIRLERPFDVAEYVLGGKRGWDREAVLKAVESGKPKTIVLPEPVPVHILYWTAWVDEDGTAHFRRDIYGRDRRLDAALRLPPPAV